MLQNVFIHTKTCIQCVQIIPKSDVHTRPTTQPEFLNASGIAKIPVPIFPFNKWIIVSKFLKNKSKIEVI